ncbi:hypothetical protein [Aeromonas sp. 604443]|uniref:hypothetical protein n=1 Tax=Aeromonas sp. 604443 TaxID=2712054 RepID=UPI003BA15476
MSRFTRFLQSFLRRSGKCDADLIFSEQLVNLSQGIEQGNQQLSEGQLTLRDDISRLQAITELLREKVSSLPVMSSANVHDVIVTAAELEDVFVGISKNIKSWQQCNIVFVCPVLHDGVSLLLQDQEVIYVRNVDDFVLHLKDRHVTSIGIASPWLMQDFIGERHILNLLLRACQSHILYIDNCHFVVHSKNTRKCLHKVGFYEIAQLSENQKCDFVSIGCLPDGSYSVFGSAPAIYTESPSCVTLRAARLPICNTENFYWENLMITPFDSTKIGFMAPADGFSLAIAQAKTAVDDVISIKAKFSWLGAGSGHASLVACYSGPQDSHMYACMLQASTADMPVITLWVNDGSWRIISEPKFIPCEEVNVTAGQYSTIIALSVMSTKVMVEVGSTLIIDVIDTKLTRTPRVGIRASDNQFAVSQITT